MFLEVLTHAIALDIGFFIDLVLHNLFWVFAIYTIMYFFFNGKKVLYFTVFFAVLMWAYGDMQTLTNLVWTSASFLLLYYLSKLAVLAMVESMPGIKKYIVVISTIQAISLILIFNFLIK